MGGDEVFGACWDRRPAIKEWMSEHGIEDYNALQVYYRNQQRQFVTNKTKLYWANEVQHIPPQPDDIIHFWGPSDTINLLADLPNKIILSPTDFLYINSGFGFIWGNFAGTMKTWRDVYAFNPLPEGIDPSRILGAEVGLWGEVNSESTLDNYLWIRASSLAERLWSNEKDTIVELATRLVAMQKSLVSRGINASPVTVELCEYNITACFTQ